MGARNCRRVGDARHDTGPILAAARIRPIVPLRSGTPSLAARGGCGGNPARVVRRQLPGKLADVTWNRRRPVHSGASAPSSPSTDAGPASARARRPQRYQPNPASGA
jgi:hypothetical protein